jgi:type II secretory ATPase GspE/PulE/Tfp pilus assembly ATPase PilB-like protein
VEDNPAAGSVRAKNQEDQVMPIVADAEGRVHPALGQQLTAALESGASAPSGADEPEVQALADALLRDAVRERASDVHLDPQRDDVALRFRIDGAIVDVADLAPEPARRLLNQFKTLTQIDPVSLFAPQESRFTYTLDGEEVDLRVAFAPCVAGEKLTIRMLDTRQLRHDIRDLGLPESMLDHVEQWLHNVSGMFLVTGPTGSGKTTTLYALLHELRLLERSIVTLEDPVEYQIDRIAQLQVDEQHDLTFRNGLKAMLRLDPDFLLMGEIRDSESARAAAAAASTGHVLLSTLHSRDPVSAVTTLRNWGLEDHEITASLQVVVSQRLVRKLCPSCRREEAPTPRDRRWLRAIGEAASETVWQAVGCDECRGLGYAGRIGVFEVWRLQDRDLELIADHATERVLRQHLRASDHETLLGDALQKARAGETTVRELMGSRLVTRCAPAGTPLRTFVETSSSHVDIPGEGKSA